MTKPDSPHVAASPVAPAPAPPWRRWTAYLLLLVLGVNGCYSTRVLVGPAAPDTPVVLNLSYEGSVAYGDQIGRGATGVEGLVESMSDSALVLRISAVRNASGRLDTWNGERFRFAPAYVTNVRVREFSRSRTTLLSVAAVTGVVAAFLTVRLVGSGSERPETDPRPPGGDQ